MGKNFLIDTNSVIDYLKDSLPPAGADFLDEIVNDKPQVSVVTEIEILGFNGDSDEMNLLSDFINDCTVFELDRSVVKQTIALRKSHKIKLPDAIIAATALVHGLTLISRNFSDFGKVPGLKMIDPHTL